MDCPKCLAESSCQHTTPSSCNCDSLATYATCIRLRNLLSFAGYLTILACLAGRQPSIHLSRKLLYLGIKHLTGLNTGMIVPLFFTLYCQRGKEELTYMKDKFLAMKLSIQVWQFFSSIRRQEIMFTQLRVNHMLDTWTFVT
jgi:hypothetical protein